MVIQIEISEKIMNLAAATLTAGEEDPDFDNAVGDVVMELEEQGVYKTELKELGSKTYPMKLALAILAIGEKLEEKSKKEDDELFQQLKEAFGNKMQEQKGSLFGDDD